MSTPTWNDIRTRAATFAQRWADENRENAEAQTFWSEFLAIYGVDRRRVAQFERRVDGLATGSGRGRIDMLWPGLFLAEHKARGRDLAAATEQALGYVAALPEHERPQWVATSDFGRIRLQEVATGSAHEVLLGDLPQQVERFGFLIGRQLRHLAPSDPVNVDAAHQMAELHDLLAKSGYTGHQLELLLVRILFLLFGDDTGLWDERGLFYDVLADHTRPDGDDLGATLARLFQVLDTPRDRRQALPDWLSAFPYVNGQLFAERIDMAAFSPRMRQMLLDACTLDWGAVSPAIFGNMFQAVMHPELRAQLGAHYTSEENIVKVVGPLFLDDLHRQRNDARGDRRRLQTFLDLLPQLRFFDPACGSGNFLLVAFRELRRLELDALAELLAIEGRSAGGQGLLDISYRLRVSVTQFYGIEFEDFAAEVARVALWLAEHQANLEASQRLGQTYVNLPLRQAPHIRQGDALAVNWAEHLNLSQDAQGLAGLYIVGNPPFTGSHLLSDDQRAQVVAEFQGITGAGQLDYVAAWYMRAARLMNSLRTSWPSLPVATSLVSTDSISQGQQVAPLWGSMLRDQRMVITSAHQTFKWSNDAPGVAQVACIIVQFQRADQAGKKRRLFTYANPRAAPVETDVPYINGYMAASPDVIVTRRNGPLVASMPEMVYGNKPVDGSRENRTKMGEGNLIMFTQAERDALLAAEPKAARFVKPLIGAEEYLHAADRWVLWLRDAEPHELSALPKVRERMQRVEAFRAASKKLQTRQWASRSGEFVETRQKPGPYIVIGAHTSENRAYVPFAYFDDKTIVTNAVFIVPDADPFVFGLLQSAAHMAWLHAIGGRLESRYRYASDVVYNTMPWPERSKVTPRQLRAIETAAAAVLAARASHPDSTLAQMYDHMPRDLREAHTQLDRAVDGLYGLRAGATEGQRLAVLLMEYQRLMGTLESQTVPKKATKRKKAATTAS